MSSDYTIMIEQCERQAEKVLNTNDIDEILSSVAIFDNYFEQLKQIISATDNLDYSKLDSLNDFIEKIGNHLSTHKSELAEAIQVAGKSIVAQPYRSKFTAARRFDSRI